VETAAGAQHPRLRWAILGHRSACSTANMWRELFCAPMDGRLRRRDLRHRRAYGNVAGYATVRRRRAIRWSFSGSVSGRPRRGACRAGIHRLGGDYEYGGLTIGGHPVTTLGAGEDRLGLPGQLDDPGGWVGHMAAGGYVGGVSTQSGVLISCSRFEIAQAGLSAVDTLESVPSLDSRPTVRMTAILRRW